MYPELFEVRINELREAEQMLSDQYFLRLDVGNTWHELPNGGSKGSVQLSDGSKEEMKYGWTLYVRGVDLENQAVAERVISHITIQLPSNKCIDHHHNKLKKAESVFGCYELESQSSCSFRVAMAIHWSHSLLKNQKYRYTHLLSVGSPDDRRDLGDGAVPQR